MAQLYHKNHRYVHHAGATVAPQGSPDCTQCTSHSHSNIIAGLHDTCVTPRHHTVLHLPIHKVSLSVITQSFIFPFPKCHSLSSHSPSPFHSNNATLCHHTVLHLPIHKVSLSVITQSFTFPFTQCHSLSSHSPSSSHSQSVTLCIHTQSFIFPFTQCHSLYSHSLSSSHSQSVTLCHHTVLHLPSGTVAHLSRPSFGYHKMLLLHTAAMHHPFCTGMSRCLFSGKMFQRLSDHIIITVILVLEIIKHY